MNVKEVFNKHLEGAEDSFFSPGFLLKIGGVAIVLFFLTFFSFSWTMESVIHNRKEVLVPDISGKSAANALQLVSEQNLSMKIEGYEFNDSVPIGTLLRQAPASEKARSIRTHPQARQLTAVLLRSPTLRHPPGFLQPLRRLRGRRFPS